MKINIYNLVIVVTSLFIINACSSSTTPTAKQILKKEKEQEKAAIDKTECTIDNAPKWYLNPPDGANVVAYYPAFAEKNTIERAKKQAIYEAQKDLADALGARLSSQTKEWIMEVGTDTIANDLDQATKKVVAEQSVAGYTLKEVDAFNCKSKNVMVYVLLEYVLGSENKVLMEKIKQDKALESELRRSEAFKELEEEINKNT